MEFDLLTIFWIVVAALIVIAVISRILKVHPFLGVWIAGVLCLWALGAYLAWNQYQKIAACRPIEVTVVSKRIEVDSNDDRDTVYRPKVRYNYKVNGDLRSCDKVFPNNEASGGFFGRRWAQRTIDRFQIGQRLVGYYDPERPSDAFLLKRPSFGPYFMLLVSTVMLFIGVSAAVHEVKGKNWDPETRSTALIWHGAGLVVFGPYFLLAGRESGMIGVLCAVGYFAFGVACFWDSQWGPSLNLLRRVYLSLVTGAILGGIAGGLIGTLVGWVAWFAFNRSFGGPVWMIHGAVIGAILSIVELIVSAVQGKQGKDRSS